MARPAASEEDKLYKIGEVCKLADLQPYVLRYWETEFPQLAPGKSGVATPDTSSHTAVAKNANEPSGRSGRSRHAT